MAEPLSLWIVFGVIVLLMLALDLGVFHKNPHKIDLREATIWSIVWIGVSLLFNLGLYFYLGTEPALKFLAGYLIEKSLSVDNIFVFAVLFNYFAVPPKFQHRILFWGIVGAVVFRGILIVAGIALINQFHWIIYLFGAFLVFTGIKMGFSDDEEVDPNKNPVLTFLEKQRWFPVINIYEEGKFFVRHNGVLMATPMFVVLMVVETTDIMFALDSIPAILSITTDSFIVFSSNIFAILGLRALYFLLAGIMELFQYLKHGLAIILTFVGIKMLISDFYHIPIGWALGFIGVVLLGSILLSVYQNRKTKTATSPSADKIV